MTTAEAKRHQHSIDPRVRAEAARVLAAAQARKRRTAPRRADRLKAKAAKAARHAADTARIRAYCERRAAGVGELCGHPLHPEEAQLCHLDGGSGKRRQLQSVENCVMEHPEHHQGPLGFDNKPLAWLAEVKAWAERHGYPVPERFRKLEALKGGDRG
jgi:hypothetical protein